MTAVAGYGGTVKVGGTNVVAEIGEWDLTIDTNMADTTKFGDRWKDQLSTIGMWNGSIVGRLDVTDTTGQIALQNAVLAGTTVTLNLYINGTNSYTGTAYIKSIAIKTPASATVDATFTVEGTGAITYS